MKSVVLRSVSVAVFTIATLLSHAVVGQAASCDQFKCATMHDTIPNFAGAPTIRSLKTGNWSSATTWNLGRVPTATDIVGITGGTTVTVDGTAAVAGTVGIEALGKLAFRTDISTQLTVGTMLVLPQGTLEVGTATAPVAPAVTAEIVIADVALDLTNDGVGVYDPRQFGTGLIAIDAKVSMAGSAKTPFVRLASEPKVGDTTLLLSAAVSGWRAGDRIFLPDSRHVPNSLRSSYVYQGETLTVSSVSTDGLTVTLASALQFAHPGARDGNDVLEFLPHVGNLTRNVVIRSANAAGTRGHVLLTERSDVDLRYVGERNLGRTTVDPLDSTTVDAAGNVTHVGTNQIGRYPLHIHHLLGPVSTPANGYQFTVLGLASDDDAVQNRRKWAITVHGSHYGQISDNVVYNAGGWGIGTEDGSESFNVFSSNFIAKVWGEGDRMSSEGGNGIWMRGPNNYVRDNVVSSVMGKTIESSHAYEFYFYYLGNICVPNFKGADMSQCTTYSAHRLPILEFARNEAYGAMEIALTAWWVGSDGYTPMTSSTSVFKDFRAWHFSLYGYYGYPTSKVTFDGFVARGAKAVISNSYEFVLGIHFNDYMTHDGTVQRADIQNLRTGILAPFFSKGLFTIQDSYLRNANNIAVLTIGAPGAQPDGASMPPKQTVIRNVGFGAVNGSIGGLTQADIYMHYTLHGGSANLVKHDGVYVYGYNKVAGDDFQVFYNEQAPTFVVPQSSGYLAASPAAGLTNAQNWSTYGLAIAGEVATNTIARSGIYGLVRPGTPPTLATSPSITSAPVTTTVAPGTSATFSVVATGTGPLQYQWFKGGLAIPGATAATYTTPATVLADSGSSFWVQVYNAAGQVVSNPVTLYVYSGSTTGGTTGSGGTTSGSGENAVTNKAPVVNAGVDQTVRLTYGAKLAGKVTDDGLPSGVAVKVMWSLVSGPAAVTFGTPASTSTTVKFTKTGTYTIRLTANDSKLSGTDDVVVTVTR